NASRSSSSVRKTGAIPFKSQNLPITQRRASRSGLVRKNGGTHSETSSQDWPILSQMVGKKNILARSAKPFQAFSVAPSGRWERLEGSRTKRHRLPSSVLPLAHF